MTPFSSASYRIAPRGGQPERVSTAIAARPRPAPVCLDDWPAGLTQHPWRSYLRPHRVALATASVVTVAETALDLAVPWPLKLIVAFGMVSP